MNKACLDEPYLFIPQCCIPRRDFLAVHRALAQPGRFCSGGALRLPMATSRAIAREDVLAGRALDPAWLRAHGAPWSIRLARLGAGPALSALLDGVTPTRPTFNGGNASVWRTDAVRVNGFDERMEHARRRAEHAVEVEFGIGGFRHHQQ